MNSRGMQKGFEFQSGPIAVGAVLVGVGLALATVGAAVASIAALTQGKRWVQTLDPPVQDLAKIRWSQAKAVGAAVGSAGADAWKNSSPVVSD